MRFEIVNLHWYQTVPCTQSQGHIKFAGLLAMCVKVHCCSKFDKAEQCGDHIALHPPKIEVLWASQAAAFLVEGQGDMIGLQTEENHVSHSKQNLDRWFF